MHRLDAPRLICDLEFSPDRRRLAAVSQEMVKLWDVGSGHEALTLRGRARRHWDPPFNPRLAFSPDGAMLAGTNWDESISLWEAPPLEGTDDFRKLRNSAGDLPTSRTGFWHLQEAEFCLLHNNPKAARFHLSLVTDDFLAEPLRVRRDRLKQSLLRD